MSDHLQSEIDLQLDELLPRLIDLRRHLHMHPEPSGKEVETSLHLYTQLGNEGLRVELGPEGIGVIADLETAPPGATHRRIAIRGDIDALQIQDEKQVPYRSQRDGVMHACGHDVHTTMVFGSLCVLKRLHDRGSLPVLPVVRGIFQPAEETAEGAEVLVKAGVLEGVHSIIATHVDPSLAVGQIGIREGALTASCDDLVITIEGRGGHAARPHESRDPITAAAELISSLYLHLPRVTDSQDAVVLTIGKIAGGHCNNVIPERIELEGTIRTLDARVRQHAKEHILRIANGVAATSQTTINVAFGVGTPSVINDTLLVGLMRQVVQELFGNSGVHEIHRASMGSEDFAVYSQFIPAAMVRVGCSGAACRSTGLHTATFDVDEQTIRVGCRLLVRTVIEWLKQDQRVQSKP